MANIPKIKKGDWLFTCSMQPEQFGEWIGNEEILDFVTLNGSSHAVHGCGLKKITKKYATWFIKNQMWQYLKFFKRLDFAVNTPYSKLDNGLYTKTSKSGVKCVYEKILYIRKRKVRKRYKCLYCEYCDIKLSPFDNIPDTKEFEGVENFDTYRQFVQGMAEKAGLKYEGV